MQPHRMTVCNVGAGRCRTGLFREWPLANPDIPRQSGFQEIRSSDLSRNRQKSTPASSPRRDQS